MHIFKSYYLQIYSLKYIDSGKHSKYDLCFHWLTLNLFFVISLLVLVILNVILIQAVQNSR